MALPRALATVTGSTGTTSALVETLDPDSLGSDADRRALSQETPNPLRARRAVVCDMEPRGSFRRVWSWPRSALEVFSAPDVAIYRSDAATERAARLARRRWPEVVEALATRSGGTGSASGATILVGVPVGSDVDGRVEHGWLQVDGVDEQGGRGRLLRGTIDGRVAGTEIEFQASEIDGWRLVSGETAIGPEDRTAPADFLAGLPG